MSRPAASIKIGEMIEAVIGPINIVDCVRNPNGCQLTDVCDCRWVYQLINRRITAVLEEITLADLASKDPTHSDRRHSILNKTLRPCGA